MADRFVRKTGSDSNNGNSAATAWLTIGKALGAAGAASGDVIYVGAGSYRETVSVAMTSPAAETRVVGDVDGAKTGDAGEVILTAYTTDDTTAPAAAAALSLAGRDNLTFERITFIGGNAGPSCVNADTAVSTGVTFRECAFIPGSKNWIIGVTGSAGVALNWTIERCRWLQLAGQAGLVVVLPTHSAGYDANVQVRNCLLASGSMGIAVYLATSGALAGKPGGVDLLDNTFLGNQYALFIADANYSTTVPSVVEGNLIPCDNGLLANVSGQIAENWNWLLGLTPRTNVSAGANSLATHARALLVSLGQEAVVGSRPRPFLTPLAASPLLGWNGRSSPLSVDLLNRPRPSGGGSLTPAVGALERHDTAARETTTVRTGSNAVAIAGPGSHEFEVAVPAAATTVGVYGRYDSNHGATTKPQLMVVNGGECGVADATATMTAAADTWQQMTLSFTPTAAGVVTVRLVARPAAASGKAFFDDFSVT